MHMGPDDSSSTEQSVKRTLHAWLSAILHRVSLLKTSHSRFTGFNSCQQ